MILSILRRVSFVLLSPFIFCLGLVISIVRPFHPNNVWLISSVMGRLGCWLMGIKITLRNGERLDQSRPCIFICNHQDSLDMIIGARIIPQRTVSLGKSSLKYVPIFGQVYWLSGNILIDRLNPAKSGEQLKKISKEVREKDLSVWIFPEGTRSKGKGLLPFKTGAFRIAIDAGVPIVPIVFSSYYGKMNWRKRRSLDIISKILEPIETTGLTLEDAGSLRDKTRREFLNCLEGLDKELQEKRQ